LRDIFAHGRASLLNDWWQDKEPAVIYDYGCGSGHGTAVLARYFARSRVYSLDVFSRCIARGNQHAASERVSFHLLDGDEA
jgi:trans-aconitate methyltransferase